MPVSARPPVKELPDHLIRTPLDLLDHPDIRPPSPKRVSSKRGHSWRQSQALSPKDQRKIDRQKLQSKVKAQEDQMYKTLNHEYLERLKTSPRGVSVKVDNKSKGWKKAKPSKMTWLYADVMMTSDVTSLTESDFKMFIKMVKVEFEGMPLNDYHIGWLYDELIKKQVKWREDKQKKTKDGKSKGWGLSANRKNTAAMKQATNLFGAMWSQMRKDRGEEDTPDKKKKKRKNEQLQLNFLSL